MKNLKSLGAPLCLALSLALSSVSIAFGDVSAVSAIEGGAWNGWNNPLKMDAGFELNFDVLPKSGNLESAGLAWPGFYWANNKGGIAHRWRASYSNDFEYSSPGRDRALSLDQASINELSPAEKYDLLMGRYDYPTVSTVWGQTREGHKEWYGICHGVSPSSLNHPEPMTHTLTNADGINITFFSSDIKALLAYYYAKVSDSKTVQIGKRCFVAGWLPVFNRADGCNDVNPGSFHVIMANRLGLEGKGFIADMERYAAVWNHAAVKYSSKVLETSSYVRRASVGSVQRVKVRSSVLYSASVQPSEEAILGTDNAKYDERVYTYWLDLNAQGHILGGEWVSADRPDFLWIKEKAEFSGYWSGLKQVYKSQY